VERLRHLSDERQRNLSRSLPEARKPYWSMEPRDLRFAHAMPPKLGAPRIQPRARADCPDIEGRRLQRCGKPALIIFAVMTEYGDGGPWVDADGGKRLGR
jgi:hypothetical protein